jgi:hypothetical protein
MSEEDEARVDALMAEIHVLMVGSRQVTESIVHQLDWAEATEVKPFGRVKTADIPPWKPDAKGSGAVSDHVEVIGAASGVLVRSVSWQVVMKCSAHGSGCPEGDELSMRVSFHERPDMAFLTWRERSELAEARRKRAEHKPHEWSDYYPDKQTYDAWVRLSLIILADS